MEVEIKAYPAKDGDCFLISYGTSPAHHKKHFLIDCGYEDTVKNYLRKDLQAINDSGECIERLILTHIDADHITGAIKLLKENNAEKFINIKQVWHNTFRHLNSVNTTTPVDHEDQKILDRIIRKGYPVTTKPEDGEHEISAKQGTTVGALILQGGYCWNKDYSENAVCLEIRGKVVIDQDTEIILLSPDRRKLDKLKEYWKSELERYGLAYDGRLSDSYDDAFEMLVSWEKASSRIPVAEIGSEELTIDTLLNSPFKEDTTVTNGSSIALMLKVGDKMVLMLGDSHPATVLDSLNKYQREGEILFDLIKVSHHGSQANTCSRLLLKIDAPIYLISTNGAKHNHPDKETIANIIARPGIFHRKLFFNYVTVNSRHFDRDDWMKKYNYSIHYLDKPPYSITL